MRAQPAKDVKVFRGVKRTLDCENEPPVDIRYVPVDFSAGVFFLYGDLNMFAFLCKT